MGQDWRTAGTLQIRKQLRQLRKKANFEKAHRSESTVTASHWCRQRLSEAGCVEQDDIRYTGESGDGQLEVTRPLKVTCTGFGSVLAMMHCSVARKPSGTKTRPILVLMPTLAGGSGAFLPFPLRRCHHRTVLHTFLFTELGPAVPANTVRAVWTTFSSMRMNP